MQGRPPATPQDLRTEVIIYRRVVTERSPSGQVLYTYVKRRGARVALRRQRSSSDVVEHNLTSQFQDYLVGNWWDWMQVEASDIVLRCGDRVQFGLHGKPINWQGRNRWAIIELVSNGDCLEGIDSVNCVCDEDPETLAPPGTADVDQDLPPTPPPDPPVDP